MRGFFTAVVLFLVSSSFNSYGASVDQLLQSCIPDTDIKNVVIQCRLSGIGTELDLFLNHGTQITVSGTSARLGRINKTFAVTRISHLAPRLSDAGPMDQSVRFLGKSGLGAFVTTIAVPCHQFTYAAVGIGASDSEDLPSEHIAICKVLK
jgi:hypothetical protein